MAAIQKDGVSIIIPSHNESGNVRELARQITAVMKKSRRPYEVIFINDGSTDETWPIIESLSGRDRHIKGIDLAGNFGQTIALRAGFEAAVGAIIVAMDGDLQHDPGYIPEMLKLMDAGYDMVGGYKEKRPEGWVKSFLGGAAHFLVRRLSGVNLKYFGATFKAYRPHLLKNINLLGDSHRFLGAIIGRLGVRYTEIPMVINRRASGQSSYRLTKIFSVIIDLFFLKFFISYMHMPFRFFGVAGLVFCLLGLVPSTVLVFGALFANIHIKEDFIAEFFFLLFLVMFGLLLFCFGLIAQMGAFSYYARGNVQPYGIRRHAGRQGLFR